MDEASLRTWFQQYLREFVALGRGDHDDRRRLLEFYSVPLLVSTDGGTTVLTDEGQLLAVVGGQLDGMRAAGYDRSEELSSTATAVVNRTSALHRAAFARLRADGSEIGRIDTTYLVADLPLGRRICALLVHSAA
jgi:hypothetical protein